ncbi:MAG: succinylglutamate desuccinylase/aspartoacylase family protein [DPANN group archaeon]|nr:succinylglutamate desuccinylase/aspartoacylase family protein [DPANN group archaeon]
MICEIYGKGSCSVALVACIHGDEQIWINVIEKIKLEVPKEITLVVIIANEKAKTENTRFIQSDLNRVFPGALNGDYESQLAFILKNILQTFDYVIDLHSTEAITEMFAIFTKNEAFRLLDFIPLKNIVAIPKILAKGKSLIDNVSCGVSIEVNDNEDIDQLKQMLNETLNNIVKQIQTEINKDYYHVFDNCKEDIAFENFVEYKKEFIPILYGAKSYKDITCLKAKKCAKEELVALLK